MFLIPGRCTVGLLGTLLILASGVSAADHGATPDVTESPSWEAAAPIAGVKPLYGVQALPVTLDARANTCASNGSNFCFGDSVNFCAACGVCCGSSSSGYCCAADQVCCGTACCASGQTCTDGKCYLPLVTVTVTSATEVTVSHVATDTVTVEHDIVSTSMLVSTTQVTVTSGGGTETDVVYVTVTASPSAAKRAAVVDDLEARQEISQDGIWDTLHLFYRRFSFPWTETTSAPVQRRALRATQAPMSAISSSTVVTTSVTRTSDVTSFVSVTTTVPTSSLAFSTIVQTKTHVVGARTTTTTTSTITVTPQAASTQTVTETDTTTPPLPSNTNSNTNSASSPSPTSTASSGGSSSGLSKKAIAGIAGGIGGAAFLIVVLALLWWFRRRRNRGRRHQDPSSYLEPYIPDMSSPIPGPRGGTSPGINRFGGAAPHHTDGGVVSDAGAVAGVKNLNRYSNISGGPGAKKSLSPRLPDAQAVSPQTPQTAWMMPGGGSMAEASGGEVYEVDGTSSAPPLHEIHEADGGQLPYASYPTDAAEMEDSSSSSPIVAAAAGRRGGGGGHTRNASSGSSRHGSQAGDNLHTGLSPVSEVGEGPARFRNTDPYRTPGTYRDF